MPYILIADDEKVIADSMVRILTDKGYEASAVYSGEDAVEAAMRTKPDIVLTQLAHSSLRECAPFIARLHAR